MYISVSNQSIGQILEISLTVSVSLKIFNSVFIYIEIWCAEPNSRPLEIEDFKSLGDIKMGRYSSLAKGYSIYSRDITNRYCYSPKNIC